MAITIEGRSRVALSLLYLRYAWDIDVPRERHELSPMPEVGSSRPPEVSNLSAKWERLWSDVWAWYALNQNEGGGGFREPPPDWRTLIERGGEVDHAALEDWIAAVAEDEVDPRNMAILGQPESECARAVAHAWAEGLRVVVPLPYRGNVCWRPNPSVLVVSSSTRRDPGLYARALGGSL